MEIRVALAIEVAEQIGARVLPERCDRFVSPGIKCTWPLMAKAEQGMMPFCWGCTTNARTVMEGRVLLFKAKLAAQGMVIEDCQPTKPPDKEDEEASAWPEGVPL